eukprot:13670757-Heterocapsa_arctica.AAC.1
MQNNGRFQNDNRVVLGANAADSPVAWILQAEGAKVDGAASLLPRLTTKAARDNSRLKNAGDEVGPRLM